MNPDIAALAEEVIRRADRQHPADELLRETFVRERGRRREGPGAGFGLPSSGVSRAVFNYYRWFGWLERSKPLREQIEAGDELARKFRKAPAEFQDADLLDRSLPAWVKEEVALTPALVRALQAEPRLWLRALRGKGPAIARKLRDCEAAGPGPMADTLQYFGRQDIFKTAEFYSGDIQIQDISSQAVGFLCAPKPGETWWDACAGQGGKTLHLSDLMENKGLIWASDKSEWRLKRLKARAAKAKMFNYRAVQWDGGTKLPTKTAFDGVLVDAPCSGVGTWHRNPHARWTTTPDDVRELGAVQLDLLAKVSKAVKPGGRLIYSVCTITRAETTAVADAFEKQFPEFKPITTSDPLNLGAAPGGRHWFLPQDKGGNGMFAAVWVRG